MTEPCPSCGKFVKHRITVYECADRQMSEAKLQTSIMGRARRRGWRVAHAGKGWVGDDQTGQFITPMPKGWPDLTLAKVGHALLFFELKRELQEPDDDQIGWLQLLNRTGNYAIVVKPSDLREGRVNSILNIGAPLREG